MKEFPSKFRIENSDQFTEWLYERNVSYMRLAIYEHMLENDKENAFDLKKFNDEKVKDMIVTRQIADAIIDELIERGWECAIAYGGTFLYIYPPGEKPISCGEEIN